jgi:iron complex outermembrane receptor protein
MNSELEHPNDILFGASLLIPQLPGTSLGVNALFDQDQKSYSAFTALTWNVNAQWRA